MPLLTAVRTYTRFGLSMCEQTAQSLYMCDQPLKEKNKKFNNQNIINLTFSLLITTETNSCIYEVPKLKSGQSFHISMRS